MNPKYIFFILFGCTVTFGAGMWLSKNHNEEKKVLQTTIEDQNKQLHRAASIVEKERESQFVYRQQIKNNNETRRKEIREEMEYYKREIRAAKREFEMAEQMYNEINNKVTLRFKKQKEDKERYYREAMTWRDRGIEYNAKYERLADELNRLN